MGKQLLKKVYSELYIHYFLVIRNFYKVFNPVLTNVVKRQITKEIENKVIGIFHKGDEKLTKHLGGRRNSKNKDKRRGSFFSQVAQVVNHKFVNGLK